MLVFKVKNVNEALPIVLKDLKEKGTVEDSRNGKVIKFNEPITTVYENPLQRVLFNEKRNCNPFFHFIESLWMLNGQNDLKSLTRFVSTMSNYSDDGKTLNGAYGYRWKNHFDYDQIKNVVSRLQDNPKDRRAVISMWDGHCDGLNTHSQSKDYPCNLQALFSIDKDNKLNMTITNRSNDIIWGAYGANAVHFSYLLEYVASWLGVEVGKYYQISNNFHAYLSVFDKLKDIVFDPIYNPYKKDITHTPLLGGNALMKNFDGDLYDFMYLLNEFEDTLIDYKFQTDFFNKVAKPIVNTHIAYKEKYLPSRIVEILESCEDFYWKKACREWLTRKGIK